MDIQRLNATQRILGIDYGERYMGWAISDPSWRVATPLAILDRRQHGFDVRLNLYIQQYGDFAALVMGLPLRMDGTHGPQAQKVQRFAERHKDSHNIILWDERLTSQAVTRNNRDKHVDDLAATFMLQGFLDQLNRKS